MVDPELRSNLLEFYLANATSGELSDWLRDIGADPKGSVDEKRARIRATTKYLTMPREEFPEQTRHYLAPYSSGHLADLCEALGLSSEGSKDARYRRIMREVGKREGWLPSPPTENDIAIASLRSFIEWYPITTRGKYEKDYYGPFESEMTEVVGERLVHAQLPVASGTTLKIDFHIGHPQRDGVGVEFKMPTNNGDMQRAFGQVDQYLLRYSQRLIVLLVPDLMTKAAEVEFIDRMTQRRVEVIVK